MGEEMEEERSQWQTSKFKAQTNWWRQRFVLLDRSALHSGNSQPFGGLNGEKRFLEVLWIFISSQMVVYKTLRSLTGMFL